MTAPTSPSAPVRFPSICAAWLAAVVFCVPHVAAAEAAPERALRLHDEARTLYAAGKYREAISRLEEAVRLDPTAKVLFYNLGLIEEKRGRLDAAIGHYRRCLALERSPRERKQLESLIERLQGAQRHGGVAESPTGALQRPAKPVGPPPDQGGSGPVSPWVWVTGATAVSALAVGAIMASRAGAIDPGKEATTGPDLSLDELRNSASEAHSMAIGADVAFGLAFAATAATVVLAIWAQPDEGPAVYARQVENQSSLPEKADLRLELAPGRGRLVWRF
jgi:tetratricopeptide (TPR) repeat protein